MKTSICLLLLLVLSLLAVAQKTLLVEKTGSKAKYFYTTGDKIKLKSSACKNLIKGEITSIRDSSLTVFQLRSTEVELKDIICVFRQFERPKKAGIRFCQFGAVIFLVMVFNNLIDNSPAFSQYVFIVSGTFLGAGLILFALAERPCRIGYRWKVKILEGRFQ